MLGSLFNRKGCPACCAVYFECHAEVHIRSTKTTVTDEQLNVWLFIEDRAENNLIHFIIHVVLTIRTTKLQKKL